jgi:hypothetical protein
MALPMAVARTVRFTMASFTTMGSWVRARRFLARRTDITPLLAGHQHPPRSEGSSGAGLRSRWAGRARARYACLGRKMSSADALQRGCPIRSKTVAVLAQLGRRSV